MVQKNTEKERALALRRRGLSYREILAEVPVAKSTLSLWLRSVGLSQRQKQRLTEKKLAAMRRGWEKVRIARMRRIDKARQEAIQEMDDFARYPLWLIGTALYWAEGSKMKAWRRAEKVAFANMDPSMILLFREWLKVYLRTQPEDLIYEIYVHRVAEPRVLEIKHYWSRVLSVSPSVFRIYFKKPNGNPKRKNVGQTYYGVLRIYVRKSTLLNHKISSWIETLCKNYLPGGVIGNTPRFGRGKSRFEPWPGSQV